MPNAIKYNTGSESLALKKGNWWIGTGDVGKGPTSTTGYYNGITPPAGGYTIYLSKESQGPVIYECPDVSSLIDLTNNISGNSYTSADECLYYYAGQSDKMCMVRDFESIITNGLNFAYDLESLETFQYLSNRSADFSKNGYEITLGTAYNAKSSIGDQGWLNQIENITIQVVLEKIGTGTGYANHPLSKWNSSSTQTASFVLYHFENYQNNGDDGEIGFYANTQNNGWTSLTGRYTLTLGETVLVTLAYGDGESTDLWIDDTIVSTVSNRGTLSPTVSVASGLGRNMEISTPFGHGTSLVHRALIYDRRLSDAEILHNYQQIQPSL
jgi:hypothetical protein